MIWCHMGGRSQIPCLSFGRGLTHVPIFSGRLGKRCLRRTVVTGNLTFLSKGVTLRVNVSVNSSEKNTLFRTCRIFLACGARRVCRYTFFFFAFPECHSDDDGLSVKGGSAAQSIVIPEGQMGFPTKIKTRLHASKLRTRLQVLKVRYLHI